MTPRLVLVHGAFHGAWCWNRLTPELERLGISYETVELPFSSTEDDVAAVRSVIDGSDENVTVLGHSFGGAVISAAAAEGGAPYGTTTSLIFLTAFMTAPEQVVDFSGAPGSRKSSLARSRHRSIQARPGRSSTTGARRRTPTGRQLSFERCPHRS